MILPIQLDVLENSIDPTELQDTDYALGLFSNSICILKSTQPN